MSEGDDLGLSRSYLGRDDDGARCQWEGESVVVSSPTSLLYSIETSDMSA